MFFPSVGLFVGKITQKQPDCFCKISMEGESWINLQLIRFWWPNSKVRVTQSSHDSGKNGNREVQLLSCCSWQHWLQMNFLAFKVKGQSHNKETMLRSWSSERFQFFSIHLCLLFSKFPQSLFFLQPSDVQHEWNRGWTGEMRGQQRDRQTGRGRSLGLFTSTLLSKTKSFPLCPLGLTTHTPLYLWQSDSQMCFSSCLQSGNSASPPPPPPKWVG